MIYSALVKTGSSKGPLVERQEDGSLVIYLHARPHDGEANIELIKTLAKHFGVAKSHITIRSGAKSHYKQIEIS